MKECDLYAECLARRIKDCPDSQISCPHYNAEHWRINLEQERVRAESDRTSLGDKLDLCRVAYSEE